MDPQIQKSQVSTSLSLFPVSPVTKPDIYFRRCSRCVMDTTAPHITFDEKAECNFCKLHDKLEAQYPLNEKGQKTLSKILKTICKKGEGKKYDCIVGVSGGRDSTYLLYLVKTIWGLKPLAVHFNDGFDNPTAGENIKKAVEKLNVDLRTITSDWRESKDIRIAFLKASVPNLEVGTDLGIFTSLFGIANKENIPFILTGHSFRTEGIAPLSWSYVEWKYLNSVLKQHGTINLRKWRPNDPGYNLNLYHIFYYSVLRRIKVITPMFYVNYVRKEGEIILKNNLNWVNPGAHYFDDLYQSLLSYVYRVKFNADKRKFNYSALIRSGQLTREEALERLKTPYVIEDPKIIDLCIKRLGISRQLFEEFISYPPKTFLDYPNYYSMIKKLKLPIKIACKLHLIPMATYDKFFTCA